MKKTLFVLSILLIGVALAQATDPTKKVVATINDNITVTLSELQGEIRMLPQDKMQIATTKEGVQQVLDQIIQRKLLGSEGRSMKADTIPVVKEAIRRSEDMVFADYVVVDIRSKLQPVTPEQAQKYFADNESLFYTSVIFDLKQVVVATQEEANKVTAALKSGKKFDDLMVQYPGLPDGPKSGNLGSIPMVQLSENVIVALKDLKAGEYSQPIKTDNAVHVLFVVSRQEPKKLEYDKIKDDLQNQLSNSVANEQINQHVQSLVDKAKVTYDNGLMKEAILQQQQQAPQSQPPSGGK
jgi:parvulin-like peptidyl-prolyl isomerase